MYGLFFIIGSLIIGGIVGLSYSTEITNCENNGYINYKFYAKSGSAAGIVDEAEYTVITGCNNRGNIFYGSKKDSGNSNIKPCMAQIVGWSINATIQNCLITDGATDYSNLYKGLFVNQKRYCSAGNVGRIGK